MYFRYFLAALACSIVSPGAALAGPAGVIPYACIEDVPYVLLAFDPVATRVGYAAFGGASEGDETLAETAAREFHEETRCAFDRPTAEHLERLTPSESHGYVSFVAEIPFISHLAIPESPCDARIERTDWQWVKLNDLEAGLATDAARPEVLVSLTQKTITLWGKAAESLRQAQSDELLDGAKLCRDDG